MADEVTIGELGRRVDQLRADVQQDLSDIKNQIAGLSFVSDREYAADKVAAADARRSMRERVDALTEACKSEDARLERKIDEVDSRVTTAFRTAMTAVVYPILVTIITVIIMAAVN